MELRIALTGGIGSGKSFVCSLLRTKGIEVFDCDASAKRLMRTSEPLQQELRRVVGQTLYVEGRLQKQVLAKFLLTGEDTQARINSIIHPAVAQDFELSGCRWLESAIFFDSGFHRRVHIDKVICVTAPIETRILRVMKRDGITREKTLEWIECQLPQEEVLRQSDYEIVNDGIENVSKQIDELLTILTKL